MIGIIGAGAAGIISAIRLKQKNPHIRITIFEKNSSIAKKLLATGNGKCNLGNVILDEKKYNDESYMKSLFLDYPLESLLDFYQSIGLQIKVVDNRIYPYSESSASVVQLLKNLLEIYQIPVILNYKVERIEKNGDCFLINQYYSCEYLIIATGGMSSPALGSDGSIFPVLKKMNLRINPIMPSLVGIKSKQKHLKILNGLRMKAKVSLYQNKQLIAIESGEIQFKEDGVSGIVIMNLSSYLARKKNYENSYLEIDFFENYTSEEIEKMLKGNILIFKNIDLALIGIIPDKLISYLTKTSLLQDYAALKSLRINIDGIYDFPFSQVSSGGISLDEANKNLESKMYSKLYFCGEVLDIDGICGGYNLMWAFLSAFRVAESIGK